MDAFDTSQLVIFNTIYFCPAVFRHQCQGTLVGISKMFGAAFVNIFLLLAGYFIVAVFDQLLIDLRGDVQKKRPDPESADHRD